MLGSLDSLLLALSAAETPDLQAGAELLSYELNFETEWLDLGRLAILLGVHDGPRCSSLLMKAAIGGDGAAG